MRPLCLHPSLQTAINNAGKFSLECAARTAISWLSLSLAPRNGKWAFDSIKPFVGLGSIFSGAELQRAKNEFFIVELGKCVRINRMSDDDLWLGAAMSPQPICFERSQTNQIDFCILFCRYGCACERSSASVSPIRPSTRGR